MRGNTATLKAAQRQRLGALIKGIPDSQHAEDSKRICERLKASPVWQEARAVMEFVPTRGEPDIRPLLRLALEQGKRVALPRYSRADDAYEACWVSNPDRDLRIGHYGIVEPGVHCPVTTLNELDLILVPGVGFSPQGGRLGRGKGYYDRLLALYSGGKCGVAFDCQVTAEIPVEPHDAVLNCIVTPTRWLEVTRPGRS
jgi:5-formyltetrahydrofolate cyclo-ligase